MSRPAPVEMQGLSEWMGTSFDEVTSQHFAVFHQGNTGPALAVCRILEAACERFLAMFAALGVNPWRADRPLVWVCFDDRDVFDRYATTVDRLHHSRLDSYYSTRTNRVVLLQPDLPYVLNLPADEKWRGGSQAMAVLTGEARNAVLAMPPTCEPFRSARLAHELAHQLAFNVGLQKRGVMYPFWVSEGLATAFEWDWQRHLDPEASSPARLRCVLDARAAGMLVPLECFLVQAHGPAGMAASRRHYAQAWALFQYALNERTDELARYLRNAARLMPGRRDAATLLAEFIAAFGPIEAFEPLWNAFLDRRAQRTERQPQFTSTIDEQRTLNVP